MPAARRAQQHGWQALLTGSIRHLPRGLMPTPTQPLAAAKPRGPGAEAVRGLPPQAVKGGGQAGLTGCGGCAQQGHDGHEDESDTHLGGSAPARQGVGQYFAGGHAAGPLGPASGTPGPGGRRIRTRPAPLSTSTHAGLIVRARAISLAARQASATHLCAGWRRRVGDRWKPCCVRGSACGCAFMVMYCNAGGTVGAFILGRVGVPHQAPGAGQEPRGGEPDAACFAHPPSIASNTLCNSSNCLRKITARAGPADNRLRRSCILPHSRCRAGALASVNPPQEGSSRRTAQTTCLLHVTHSYGSDHRGLTARCRRQVPRIAHSKPGPTFVGR